MITVCGRWSTCRCSTNFAASAAVGLASSAAFQSLDGNALLGQQHLLAAHDAAQPQVELEFVAQARAFGAELLEQCATHERQGRSSPTEMVCGDR